MRYPINCNDSHSVWTLKVNPLTGSARVRWFNSPLKEYRHTNISRRAILGLIWYSGNVSKGEWVNHNCLQSHITLEPKLNWRPVLETMAQNTIANA